MSDNDTVSDSGTGQGGETGPEDVFDVDKIRQLTELMKEFDLCEVDLRQEGRRIQLRRGTTSAPTMVSAPSAPVAAPISPAAAVAAQAPADVSGGANELSDAEENVVYIKSPMVGTFYAKSNPDALEFVKVGDRLDPDTTVCIIEAMKVFNEIPADVSGRVVAMLVENEEAVDFGRALFKIDTSG